MGFARAVSLVLGFGLCSAGKVALAGVLRVPDPYLTIALALQNSVAGDSVLVAAGTYLEHDLTLPSGVFLGSESGFLGSVTIDAGGLGRHLVIQDADETTIVRGIELRSGSEVLGGSVRIVNSSPLFETCRFQGAQRRGGSRDRRVVIYLPGL